MVSGLNSLIVPIEVVVLVLVVLTAVCAKTGSDDERIAAATAVKMNLGVDFFINVFF